MGGAPNGSAGRPVSDLILRGKQRALRAFAPLTDVACDELTLNHDLGMIAKLEAGDPAAIPVFVALVGT